MALSNYEKGRRWGYAIFGKNYRDSNYSELGVYKSDKASQTCIKYVRDKKKGTKPLTKYEQNFYKGAISGFQEYYDKNISNVK